jgi:hypothetical protein
VHCACGNAARYVDEHGQLVCGTCPIKAGHDSIRLADVPKLLAWARTFVQLNGPIEALQLFEAEQLRDLMSIIGRAPGG